MKFKTWLVGLAFLGARLPAGMAASPDDDTGPRNEQAGAATRSTGEYIDDATITAKIKTAFLQDDRVSALDVNVSTYRGVVQLSGFIGCDGVRDRAAKIAASVNGVKSVRNDPDQALTRPSPPGLALSKGVRIRRWK